MRLAALFCLALAWSSPVAAQPAAELYICHASEEARETGWFRSSLFHMSRVLGGDGAPRELAVRRAVCNASMPDASCAGRPGGMFCRQQVLDRINVAASWLVAVRAGAGHPSYEDFRKQYPRAVIDAFRQADGLAHDDAIAAVVTELREHVEAGDGASAAADSPLVRLAAMQQRIVAYNLASLVGHEGHHMNGETCPVEARSRLEDDGVFEHVAMVQTEGRLFCPAFPDINELRADRCAMRQVERLATDPIADPADPASDETFARRAAADMVAFQVVAGYRRHPDLPDGVYGAPELDQYFRPALRLLLLAGAIPDPRTGPPVCGIAAALFVQAVQGGYEACAGQGEVSDEILALLPSGVETSWNGAPWTEASFSCDASRQ